MSQIETLLDRFRNQLKLPWDYRTSAAERVWFLVYPPAQERRMRAWLPEFEIAVGQAGYAWQSVDITQAFAEWMANLEYREAYFGSPSDLNLAMEAFGPQLVERLRQELSSSPDTPHSITALIGVASLFGFLRVSWLIEQIAPHIPKTDRLLVLFPGTHEQHNYRLLDARDGWDYLAIPIKV